MTVKPVLERSSRTDPEAKVKDSLTLLIIERTYDDMDIESSEHNWGMKQPRGTHLQLEPRLGGTTGVPKIPCFHERSV